ncbi:hypothetical protein WP50_29810 [Lactiplantibacillus plantarum]|nr:hypothetical protein WP50_29810 [Lactiplantibacillus plantarum]
MAAHDGGINLLHKCFGGGTFPQTIVIPITLSAGDLSANNSAKLSSIPGSQSIITLRVAFILLPPITEVLGFLSWEVYEPGQLA